MQMELQIGKEHCQKNTRYRANVIHNQESALGYAQTNRPACSMHMQPVHLPPTTMHMQPVQCILLLVFCGCSAL
jgi:hypothetical protein